MDELIDLGVIWRTVIVFLEIFKRIYIMMIHGNSGMSISVIFPTKNRAHYVKRAVRTAFKAHRVEEVIVIDGGSMDDTIRIAEREGAKVI
ncbi:MAG: glycosyltransferase, partial [Nitrososphaerota archaeon]